MKKFIPLFVLIVLLTISVPVLAESRIPIGEQIRVDPDGAVIKYPAGVPFHIRHGWQGIVGVVGPEGIQKLPFSGFDLEMDGSYLTRDFILREIVYDPELDEKRIIQTSVFEFPEGLTGTHTFTGHWYTACKFWEESCDDPFEVLEVQTRTITIKFIGK